MTRQKVPLVQIQSRIPVDVWQFLHDRAPGGDMSEIVRRWILGVFHGKRLVEKVEEIGRAFSESPGSPPGRPAASSKGRKGAAS